MELELELELEGPAPERFATRVAMVGICAWLVGRDDALCWDWGRGWG